LAVVEDDEELALVVVEEGVLVLTVVPDADQEDTASFTHLIMAAMALLRNGLTI
jgi:hypothetical protein